MKQPSLFHEQDAADNVRLLNGDCLLLLKELECCSVDSIVTDPPYELGFMGKSWDKSGIAYNVDVWKQCLRVLKPGGHLLAFGGSRTYHRLACAVEDAGFEIRDQIMWLYGSGFPKSLDISKNLDRQERDRWINVSKATAGGRNITIDPPATDEAKQWNGWGTALKPAHEPIAMARKPLAGTVVENVLAYGTGALNIDASRVALTDECKTSRLQRQQADSSGMRNLGESGYKTGHTQPIFNSNGRWPANVIHDGSDEVASNFPNAASRFFYCAKAGSDERIGNNHPTVKPIELMRYLCRLVTSPNGIVLDPFMGSGSTGKAAIAEGFGFVGIEINDDYYEIARQRILAM